MNYVGHLPEELVMIILQYLDHETLCHAASVCKIFQHLSNDSNLWRKFCINYASSKELALNANANWKQYFRRCKLRERKWMQTGKISSIYTYICSYFFVSLERSQLLFELSNSPFFAAVSPWRYNFEADIEHFNVSLDCEQMLVALVSITTFFN